MNLFESDNKTVNFLNLLESFNLHPTVKEAARITLEPRALIDNIITNIDKYSSQV